MPSTTLNVRGHKVRTATKCRYAVVAVRPRDVEATVTQRQPDGSFGPEPMWFRAGAWVHKRSNSYETARKHVRAWGRKRGTFAVVVDTVTGEEV